MPPKNEPPTAPTPLAARPRAVSAALQGTLDLRAYRQLRVLGVQHEDRGHERVAGDPVGPRPFRLPDPQHEHAGDDHVGQLDGPGGHRRDVGRGSVRGADVQRDMRRPGLDDLLRALLGVLEHGIGQAVGLELVQRVGIDLLAGGPAAGLGQALQRHEDNVELVVIVAALLATLVVVVMSVLVVVRVFVLMAYRSPTGPTVYT